MTKLEEVALALVNVDQRKLDLPEIASVEEFRFETDKAVYLDMARAAIAALMEPTEAMKRAGIDNCATSIREDTLNGIRRMTTPFDEECGDIWKAMIIAAMEE